MTLRRNVKAGGLQTNHNETQTQNTNQAAGLRVKTRVRAGIINVGVRG